MVDTCCPSSYSRQRAFVVVNTVPVMLRAVGEALAALPPDPLLTDVEQVLVQVEQLAHRLHPADRRACVGGILQGARASLVSGDGGLAVSDLREALDTLETVARARQPCPAK